MPPPPCPTLVPLANFSDKKAYLDYLIAFIKYFYYYSQSFIFTLQSHAGGNLKDIEEPYRAAKAQLDADTIVQRLPQLNEAALRNEYINRCIAFSKMKATNNTTCVPMPVQVSAMDVNSLGLITAQFSTHSIARPLSSCSSPSLPCVIPTIPTPSSMF